jgi:uncharacterized repeat protein (TIGR01451 family)
MCATVEGIVGFNHLKLAGFLQRCAVVFSILYGMTAYPLQAQTQQFSNTTAGTISNSATPCNAALIRNFTVSSSFTVQDVNIGVVAAHAYREDMVMALVSPAGTSVTFNSGTGGAALNFNVLLDDAAATPLTGHSANDTAASSASAPPYQRTFAPTSALSAFNGQSAQGTWQLLICDTFADDNGTFYRADLYLTKAARIPGTPPVLSCPVGQTSLDWDGISWTAGSTSNSYALANIGSTNITLTNPGTWQNSAIYGGQSPARQNGVTGGLSPAQFSLFLFTDFANQAQTASTTITLPVAVPGAQFRIFDVDFFAGQFADKVTVTGSFGGTAVTPTITNGATNSTAGNSAIGDAISGDTSGEGNIVVTFSSPVDTILITYGNHSTAPANPGVQAIALHDILFCNPQALVTLAKSSSIIQDPVNNALNPKAIPGAIVRYCLLASNAGSAGATATQIKDILPAALVYQPGSMRSGTSCVAAATIEDDNAIGTDENDPIGANISANMITANVNSLTAGSSIAIVFEMLVP